MRKIFTLLVVALISACTFSAYAAIVEGTCGDNLTWVLNTSDSTLVISGEGEMEDYASSSSPSWGEYRSFVKNVIITDGVTSIGDYAFAWCSDMTSIEISESVTSIGDYAFTYCSDLTYVTIGNSVTSIGDCAFANCSALKSATIGDGVTSIGEAAFYYCENLRSITIPNSVTSIGSYAFHYCESLTTITIPNSVTSIGYSAFAYCSSLTSVTIGNSVTSIGNSAFYCCSRLQSITIPNSVTSIGNYVFSACFSLTSVTIPNSVTSIGDDAFSSCSGLKLIEIPNSVTSIGNSAFSSCRSLSSITIPNSITSIGEGAFCWCENLSSITIPNSVTSIGDDAFKYCESLTTITIPNSVTSIGEDAFYACERLTSVTLGGNVRSIERFAFENCNIQEVTSYAQTPPSAANCGINPAFATLYVPSEHVGTYSNTTWWEDFKEIRTIDADYVVTFFDWDNTELARRAVAAGTAAIAPANPTREGYTFIGWDSDFSCVIEDMAVTAQYQINRYQVRFFDWDEKVIKTDSVDYQSAATAPTDPTREGYTFIGWDKDFSCITADLDVYAQYETGENKEFAVIFNDQEGNEISTQSVTIKVPLAPEIVGFTFLYWQTLKARLDNVITIQAVYENNVPSAAPNVYINPANKAQKLIRDGNVYILHDEKTYTITGQMIK